jgi:hypothetical protein
LRTLTIGFAAARVVYAGAVIAAPRAAAGPWLGGAVEGGGGRVAARALVARDAIISAGVAVAAQREAAVRPWLVACVASDLADIAATLADRDGLPARAATGTVALAGAAALAGAGLALAADG